MNLLLISRDVPDFQVFVDSVNPNTRAIVYSPSMTQAELMESIQLTSVERLAIVSRKEDLFIGDTPVTESAELFKSLIQTLGIKTIDFLACNTLMDPRWTQFYTSLEASGVLVGASNDLTGNLKYGGDWTMESTGEDIEHIYFTNSIEYYKYLLDSSYLTLFVKKDGTLMGAGNNRYKQLGINSTFGSSVSTFNAITGVTNVRQIEPLSDSSTMLLLNDGTLLGAGYNLYRQFGSFDEQSNTFKPITGITNVKQISGGFGHTMLLLNDGTLLGAGLNNYKQLGIDSTVDTLVDIFKSITKDNVPITNVKQIACGFNHTMILLNDGTLLGAGLNNYKQLGIDSTFDNIVETFNPITGVTNVKEIACGGNNTMLILNDGTIMGAGNYISNSGFRSIRKNNVPITNVKQISCGLNHNMILLNDGTIIGMGTNNDKQLGLVIGAFNDYTFITKDGTLNGPLITNVKQIACGNKHTVILLEDGTLLGTGLNQTKQLGIDSTTIREFESRVDTFTPIATDVLFLQGQPYITVPISPVPISPVPISPVPISNICFLVNTPVVTDQGIFPIDQLDPDMHTIHYKKIVAITKTVSQDTYLICIKKDALGPNLPSQETVITQNHKLLYQGVMTQAKYLKQVHKVEYRGEVLYNVLMETQQIMSVNNLVCETLDPDNGIAKLERILKEVTSEQKEEIIQGYNRYVFQENIFMPKEIF